MSIDDICSDDVVAEILTKAEEKSLTIPKDAVPIIDAAVDYALARMAEELVGDVLSEVYEAAVAARDGRAGAAAWIVERIQEATGCAPRAAELLNQIRPADYYTHRVPACGDASFIVSEKTVEIRRGRMRAVLPVLNTEGWPEIGEALPDGGCEIAKAEIARVIAFCGDAAERNSAFPEMESIFFDSEGEKPCAVGSNSRIVARTDLSALSGSVPKMTRAVPKDAVQLALSACGDSEMSFRSDNERVEFAWALGRLRSKIPDAPFLAWRRLLDIYSTRAEVVCQTDALAAAVTRVIAGSGGTMLGFAAADGILAIRGREKVTDPDAIDEIECDYSGDPLMFGLNATWTANALSAAKASERITLAIMGREDDRAAVVNFISDAGQWFVAQLAPRFYPEIAQRRAA